MNTSKQSFEQKYTNRNICFVLLNLINYDYKIPFLCLLSYQVQKRTLYEDDFQTEDSQMNLLKMHKVVRLF